MAVNEKIKDHFFNDIMYYVLHSVCGDLEYFDIMEDDAVRNLLDEAGLTLSWVILPKIMDNISDV